MYYEDYKRQKYLVSRNTKLYRFFTSIHCEQRKMCATNKQFYIGASSLFSAIDTSLLDRFNSRTLSSRLNPISYITHLPQPNDQFLHQFLVRLHSFLILPTLPRRHSVLPITTNVHGGRLFEHFLLVRTTTRAKNSIQRAIE